MEKTKFKISNFKHKYVIEAFKNNNVCGSLEFEILNNTKKLFIDDEFNKIKIVDEVIDKNPFIYLSYIVVNHKFQGQGVANELMNKFDKIVTNNEKIDNVLLFACPFVYEKTKLLPLDLLVKFYEKFGFNEIYNEPEGNLMIKKYK